MKKKTEQSSDDAREVSEAAMDAVEEAASIAVEDYSSQIDPNNPLMRKSTLQYQAPEFDKIKDEHYKPAFDLGFKIHEQEIQAIINNSNPATVENTLEAFEKSGVMLGRAAGVFYNLTGSNTNETLQALQEEYAPIFSAHNDKIYLNSDLYNRIKQVKTTAGSEDARLREELLKEFEIAGASLSEDKKTQLKKINSQLASLQTEFSKQLLGARKDGALLIGDVKQLAGLDDAQLEAAAGKAKADGQDGKYSLSLLNTTQQPLLVYLQDRETRRKLFEASVNRAQRNDENDTRAVISKIAKLRLQKGQLLGKRSFAEWKLQGTMAKTPEAALGLLEKLSKPSVEQAKVEGEEIQKLIQSKGEKFKLEPYDWNFYSEQVRKAKYDLDQQEVMPYLEVRNVLEKGVFYAAEKLYGLTFKTRPDLPVYHPDVVAYEVFDADGSSLAIYYLDFYTRDNKRGGAWMNNFVDQSTLLGQKPVIVNVFNYAKPAPGRPSLITFDDVETMFHEFGHSIHGMFAKQKYPYLSGTSTPRDFVEFPSQINEHWALDPKVLTNYAVHYETGKPMPISLVEKIKKAKTFNEGYMTTELVSAATLDMAWHSVTSESELIAPLDFEKKALATYGLDISQVPPRYHTPYFAHVWGGGYSAGYYSYLWSETLDADAYDYMVKNGGLTRANGDRFRKYILSVGNSVDLSQAFRDFTGHDPRIEPLLRDRGFIK